MVNFHNIDCMEFMKNVPDKYYNLAIVDPPYGIIASNGRSMNNLVLHDKYDDKKWFNEKPSTEYFNELFRISKNQIIWGGNYFDLPTPYRCPIIWDKLDYNSDFAAGEMAWSSFDKPLKIYKHARHKGKINRIHPTQKPIDLYRWLLQNYAKIGDNIIDTHGGSMTIAIAVDMEGYDLDICEIDTDYFTKGVEQFDMHKRQLQLF